MNKHQTGLIDPEGDDVDSTVLCDDLVRVIHVLWQPPTHQHASWAYCFFYFNSQSLFKNCKEHLNNYSQQHRRESLRLHHML